jgi:molybdate transport system substrate-binding protein
VRRVLAGISLIALIAACGGPNTGYEQLTVFAAASLTDAFEAMGKAYAQRHPGVGVKLNLASSSQLAGQIRQGAPADVFASADERQMTTIAELVKGQPQAFARNYLQIAVETGNPLSIHGLADLTRPGLKLVLAGETVPAGRYAAQVFAKAGVRVTPVSREVDVRAVLAKVALGEADAGIVYASDVVAANGSVEGVEIPDAQNITATYPIAVLTGASNPDSAQAFVDLVLSTQGQAILARYGFGGP